MSVFEFWSIALPAFATLAWPLALLGVVLILRTSIRGKR